MDITDVKSLKNIHEMLGASLWAANDTEGYTAAAHNEDKDKWLLIARWYHKALVKIALNTPIQWPQLQVMLRGELRARIAELFDDRLRNSATMQSPTYPYCSRRQTDQMCCHWILTGKFIQGDAVNGLEFLQQRI